MPAALCDDRFADVFGRRRGGVRDRHPSRSELLCAVTYQVGYQLSLRPPDLRRTRYLVIVRSVPGFPLICAYASSLTGVLALAAEQPRISWAVNLDGVPERCVLVLRRSDGEPPSFEPLARPIEALRAHLTA